MLNTTARYQLPSYQKAIQDKQRCVPFTATKKTLYEKRQNIIHFQYYLQEVYRRNIQTLRIYFYKI